MRVAGVATMSLVTSTRGAPDAVVDLDSHEDNALQCAGLVPCE